VTLGNIPVTEWGKRIRIRVEGTGATPNVEPSNIEAVGTTAGEHDSTARIVGVPDTDTDGSGNWFVDVVIDVFPQPETVTITFNVAGSPAIAAGAANGQAWADECCAREFIPTLSEWGVITFGMLLLTAMVLTLRRRRQAV
jgi:hypothetical protein